jgi:quinol monooxygenase YgiN
MLSVGAISREDDMTKLAIVATAEIAPGRIEEVLPLLAAHRERCLKEEPGTVQFEVLRPRDNSSAVLFYEVYTDDEAFKAHWEGPSITRFRAEAKGLIVKLSAIWCDLQD